MTCTKIQFATKDAAMKALRGRQSTRRTRMDRDAPPLDVYRCQACGCWHYGHRPGWKKLHRPFRSKGAKS